ncbi:hypothetical protein BD309DRAFT_995584 [Dichomitus squalens]|nr:hypothetical protein BD309DRAFT_995584 [Dichomitus squalens]
MGSHLRGSRARPALNYWRHNENQGQFPFDCGLHNFTNSGTIKAIPRDDICLPRDILERSSSRGPLSQWYLAILGCEHVDCPGALLGRVCCIPPSAAEVEYLYCGWVYIDPPPNRGTNGPQLFPLSPESIDYCRNDIQIKTVYISHPERTTAQSEDARCLTHETINLVLPKAMCDALRAHGYTTELRGPDEGHLTTHWLTLSNDDHKIAVRYQHILEDDGEELIIKADVKIWRHALDSAVRIKATPSFGEWRDFSWRKPSLRTQETVYTFEGKKLALKLGLDLAAQSHYFLLIDIVEVEPEEVVKIVEVEETTPAVLLQWEANEDRRYIQDQRRRKRASCRALAVEPPVIVALGADDNVYPDVPDSNNISGQPEAHDGEAHGLGQDGVD